MSLNSFFDTLDSESMLNAWKSSTIQKLNHLSAIIPTENVIEIQYINKTINCINTLNLISDTYNIEKHNIIERLHNCNLYYKKLGI